MNGHHYSSHSDDEAEETSMEGIAQLLSTIDKRSNDVACELDAHQLLEEDLFPKSFPWNKPAIPLLRTLPRDIDDIKAMWHACNNVETEPFGHAKGMFGFGGYDQGDMKHKKDESNVHSENSNRKKVIGLEADSIKDEPAAELSYGGKCGEIRAAARRSTDIGVIELMVSLIPLPSLNAALVYCQDNKSIANDPWFRYDTNTKRRVKLFVEADRAEVSSKMPLHWRLDGHVFNPPTFIEQKSLDSVGMFNNPGLSEEDHFHRESCFVKERRDQFNILHKSCLRRWLISVRVGGVSSRLSLFQNSNPDTSVQSPLLCDALQPSFIQNGKSVSVDIASEWDDNGFALSLGSYDCRFSNIDSTPTKKNHELKNVKHVHVGRTRLIWSDVVVSNKTATYVSVLNNTKFESTSHKRPRHIQVAVKLNDERLTDVPGESEILSKPAKSNRRKVSNKMPDAIQSSNDFDYNSEQGATRKRRRICTLDLTGYQNHLFKTTKQTRLSPISKVRRGESNSSSTSTSQVLQLKSERLLQQTLPRMNCIPLDDGLLRVVCSIPGSMERTPIHQMLNSVARKKSNGTEANLCTICWTGSKVSPVMECCDCGLLVHRECMKDNGKYVTDHVWKCSLCEKNMYSPEKSGQDFRNDEIICKKVVPARKSRRSTRIPSRFEDTTIISEMKQSCRIEPARIEPAIQYHGPACKFCPHFGGAMSQVVDDEKKGWAHEICRIWSSATLRDPFQGYQDSVCALCGMGQTDEKENLRVVNHGDTDSIPDKRRNTQGLVKCAAAGCFVTVHPMCALLTNKLRRTGGEEDVNNEGHSALKQSEIRDKDVCQQFSLDFLRITRTESTDATNRGVKRTCLMPAVYCGIHNPDRDESFYGCPIAAEPLSQYMTVPSVPIDQ